MEKGFSLLVMARVLIARRAHIEVVLVVDNAPHCSGSGHDLIKLAWI